jgi:hypothetical protein
MSEHAPQHDWDELTCTCRRCFKTHKDLAENPLAFACVSDRDIAITRGAVARFIGILRR